MGDRSQDINESPPQRGAAKTAAGTKACVDGNRASDALRWSGENEPSVRSTAGAHVYRVESRAALTPRAVPNRHALQVKRKVFQSRGNVFGPGRRRREAEHTVEHMGRASTEPNSILEHGSSDPSVC